MKTKPKYLYDKDPWMLAEDIPDSDIFFFQIPMSCFASDTSYPFLRNYKKVLTHYKKFDMDFYFGQKDSFDVGENILKNLILRPKLGRDINQNIVKWSKELIAFARTTAKLSLKNLSNKQLWALYELHDRIHTKLYTYGWLSVAVDMFHGNFTKKLKSYLYSVVHDKQEAERAFIILTTPSVKTIVAKEREEFLKIYDRYRKTLQKPTRALMIALHLHSGRWGHMGYIYAGNVKPFGERHYLDEMRELAKSRTSGKKLIQKEARQISEAKRRRSTVYKRLKINRKYQNLFGIATNFAITKLFRRHAQLLDLYLMHKSLLEEIARRLMLRRVEVQFMLKGEVKAALVSDKILNQKILTSRLKECVLYTEKNFEKVHVGGEMKRITAGLKGLFDKNLKELTGQTAQPGYARGIVKIIIRAKDMKKFGKGNILVSIATDPDVVPAMKKAAAIVTEQGGITSHAAIVSRELGIPCVIGTKIATKVLKDGDFVEVDANKGIVKILKRSGKK